MLQISGTGCDDAYPYWFEDIRPTYVHSEVFLERRWSYPGEEHPELPDEYSYSRSKDARRITSNLINRVTLTYVKLRIFKKIII